MAGKPKTIADMLALFWSLVPDSLDWRNLEASGVGTVMLDFYASATDAVLAELQRRGYGVILRLNDRDATERPLQSLWLDLMHKRQVCPNIDVLILGCEPDVGINMEYGSPGWYGTERAWPHAQRIVALAETLATPGLRLVTPGWECRIKSEDDPPQPGLYSWRDYCGEAYQHPAISGHGAHLYGYGFRSVVDELRVKFQLRDYKMRFHRGPLYVDEIGFASGNASARMEQFIAFLGFLERNPRMLDRVMLLCPFVSNGVPNGQWDAEWLMRAPESYAKLGEYVKGARQRLIA